MSRLRDAIECNRISFLSVESDWGRLGCSDLIIGIIGSNTRIVVNIMQSLFGFLEVTVLYVITEWLSFLIVYIRTLTNKLIKLTFLLSLTNTDAWLLLQDVVIFWPVCSRTLFCFMIFCINIEVFFGSSESGAGFLSFHRSHIWIIVCCCHFTFFITSKYWSAPHRIMCSMIFLWLSVSLYDKIKNIIHSIWIIEGT